ncbi:MAG: c-type cytochrome [Acidobacteriota bacterium]|nr:c-type cytochrome [Acidobacteriota bacterium]MDH3524086.1 c-type cytochrome [Acidobacteriota bacterium]
MKRQAVMPTIVASCLALLAGAARGQVPDEFTNLQLLGPEISKAELIATMKDWAMGLGVRCNHCHDGPDDLAGMDFASDEKATKRTARRMLAMVREINGELLADLPTADEGAGHETVSCYTCHRGRDEPPRSLAAELEDAAAEGGVDAALARYDALRAESYGGGAYDFSETALNRAAGYFMEAGRPEDAVKALEKNLEYYPESADVHALIGMIRLQSGDHAAARAALERALELDPENRTAGRAVQMLPAAPAAEEGDG